MVGIGQTHGTAIGQYGTARALRRLKAQAVDLVITTPETALTLLGRSALSMDRLTALFLAWPESWSEEESLTPLMQDLPKDTQRIIYTSAPDRVEALIDGTSARPPWLQRLSLAYLDQIDRWLASFDVRLDAAA